MTTIAATTHGQRIINDLYANIERLNVPIADTYNIITTAPNEHVYWCAVRQLSKHVHKKAYYLTNIVLSMKKDDMHAHNEYIDACKSLNRLNIVAAFANKNLPSVLCTALDCVRSFLSQQIIDLDNNKNDTNNAYNIAVQSASNAYAEEVEVIALWELY
jgi:hypothetical protein